MSAGLLLVTPVRLGGRLDRLAVRNARRFEVDVDAEPPLQLRDGDLDVELALPRQQQFLGLRIAAVADRRVLFLEAVHRRADLVLVAAALRLDRVREHRFRELDRRKLHGVGFVADDVVGERILQLCDGAKIAGLDLGHRGLRLALQQHEMAEPLKRIPRFVLNRRIRFEGARNDAEHRNAAGEWIGDGLPDERLEGRFLVRAAHDFRARRVDAFVRPVRGGRQIAEDGVEHLRNANVGERRGAHQREDLSGGRRGP